MRVISRHHSNHVVLHHVVLFRVVPYDMYHLISSSFIVFSQIQQFKRGDEVLIKTDKNLVKELQDGHGGWNEAMISVNLFYSLLYDYLLTRAKLMTVKQTLNYSSFSLIDPYSVRVGES